MSKKGTVRKLNSVATHPRASAKCAKSCKKSTPRGVHNPGAKANLNLNSVGNVRGI